MSIETGAVACIGETMAQVVPSDGKRLDDAATYAMTPAGAESNVAISLARMGTRAAWGSFVGDDPIGSRITRSVNERGVDTSLVRAIEGGRTGVFMKDPIPDGSDVYYYRSGSAAAGMDAEYAHEVLASAPRWIHMTGVTPALSASCADMVQQLTQGAVARRIPISFDVNYRPVLWPSREVAAEAIRSVAAHADVVFVGLDEARALWGVVTAEDVRELLPEPMWLIVKDGAVECIAFSGTDRVAVPALTVEVVEPVGAGDAFAAGWIHAHLLGLAPDACLRLGHLMAGIALSAHSDTGELDAAPSEIVGRAVDGRDWNNHDENLAAAVPVLAPAQETRTPNATV